MKNRWFLAGMLLLLIAQPVWAAKYVSDVLWVSLRAAADDSAESITVLRSGVKLELIDEVEVAGYAHVKASNGKQGWIKSRYLLDEPIAAIRVSSLEKQLEKLTAENEELKSHANSAQKDGKETIRERKRIISENQALIKENEKLRKVADKPMQLSEENEKLKVENERLLAENTRMSAKFDKIHDDGQRTWFMIGAGVLFAGIILGLIFPSLRFRRKSTWS